MFVIGGNGSGKTTLAKLITGLYKPDQGEFYINGQSVNYAALGEFFSVVFNPPQLFEKLYNVQLENKSVFISENLSQIVDAIKKSKQDSKKVKIDSSKVIKTQPRMINEDSGKSILHKLKDATLNFFRGFKK